jgi:hypothetical protein
MKVNSGWEDDEIRFAGFGSAHAVSDHVPTKKPKRRKFKVGFAIPKKIKKSTGSSRDPSPTIRGVR